MLIVEDEALVRGLMVRVLRSAGYQVLEASDGDRAVALARREPARFDLLITDVVMPGRSGRDTAELLEREGLARRTLFVSGYAADWTGGPEAPFLQKPFTAAGLLAAVRAALDGRPSPG